MTECKRTKQNPKLSFVLQNAKNDDKYDIKYCKNL